MSAENVTLTSRTEQRIVIKHCASVGMTPMDTHMFVYLARLKPNCSMVLVFRWHNILRDVCEDTGDCKEVQSPRLLQKMP